MKCLNVIILYDNRQEVETYLQDIAEVSGPEENGRWSGYTLNSLRF